MEKTEKERREEEHTQRGFVPKVALKKRNFPLCPFSPFSVGTHEGDNKNPLCLLLLLSFSSTVLYEAVKWTREGGSPLLSFSLPLPGYFGMGGHSSSSSSSSIGGG